MSRPGRRLKTSIRCAFSAIARRERWDLRLRGQPADRGADVTLVSGPDGSGVPGRRPRSDHGGNAAGRRGTICRRRCRDQGGRASGLSAEEFATQKIKKSKADSTIDLEPTPDILQELGARKNGKVLVGFAAETEDLAKNARAKLKAKNLDLIVVNPVGGPDSGFDSDTNRASIIDAAGKVQEIPLMSKAKMADVILDRVVALLEVTEICSRVNELSSSAEEGSSGSRQIFRGQHDGLSGNHPAARVLQGYRNRVGQCACRAGNCGTCNSTPRHRHPRARSVPTSATASAASSRPHARTSCSAPATPTPSSCSSAKRRAIDEDQQGLPFVGEAGQLLTKIIESIGNPSAKTSTSATS